jgi:hypothetical protein
MPMTVVRLLLGSYVYCDATLPRRATSWFKLPRQSCKVSAWGCRCLARTLDIVQLDYILNLL